MNDPHDFSNPWRKIYEWPMAVSWTGASALTLAVAKTLPVPTKAAIATALACAGMGAYRAAQAIKRKNDLARLKYNETEFLDLEEFLSLAKKYHEQGAFWMGKGFQWTDIEASRMYALTSMGIARKLGKESLGENGSYWLHGLSASVDVLANLGVLVGHTLISGATRVGKTRLLDLLIAQAIARNEPVIIVDPKGDKGLANNARRACELLGQPDRFLFFHPAHPDKSVCIDPLRNWNRKTELASRIAALIPSETGADPFTAFGWKVLNDIVNGLVATGIRPNLVQLRRYIEGGPDELVMRALRVHFKENVPDWENRCAGFIKSFKGNLLLAYISFYKEIAIHESPAVELDGLISTYEHNREHFQKMVASLIPILSMLTSDPLTELLSPDYEPGHDRIVTDVARAIRGDKVLFVGLDSLSDATVGSAIGSIIMADTAAVAGDRYNYGVDSQKPVNIFIDEAAEVLNVPIIQLMNKGGGAGIRVTIATQTFADFVARLGDKSKATQVLANTNNKITLRVLEPETQELFTNGIPQIKVTSMSVRYGHHVAPNIHQEYTASYQETAAIEDADLIPPAVLSELPPLHFYARLSGGLTYKGKIPILR